jgi:hypothetical protein
MVGGKPTQRVREGRKVDRERKGIADWWVLGTRPLGMAPHEPLDDTDTMRDRGMGG